MKYQVQSCHSIFLWQDPVSPVQTKLANILIYCWKDLCKTECQFPVLDCQSHLFALGQIGKDLQWSMTPKTHNFFFSFSSKLRNVNTWNSSASESLIASSPCLAEVRRDHWRSLLFNLWSGAVFSYSITSLMINCLLTDLFLVFFALLEPYWVTLCWMNKVRQKNQE